MKNQTIEISIKTILTVIGIFILLFLLLKIATIFVLIFISFILMSAINPVVVWLEKKAIPKGFSVFIAILILILILILIFFITITPITSQLNKIAISIENLPVRIISLFPFLKSQFHLNANTLRLHISNYFSQNINNIFISSVNNITSTTISIFFTIGYLILVFVMAAYMLIYKDHFYNTTLQIIPKEYRKKILRIIYEVENQLGAWLIGQVIISLVIGFLFWLFLTILGIPYAFPIAIFAAFAEIIPFVGPIISGIVACVIVLFVSPNLFILAVILTALIQQLEANIIAPQIMKKVIGINPLILIIAIFIGATLYGLLGALIAIPIVTVIQLVIYDILQYDLLENNHHDNTLKNN
jgi:predicted PurR-regulated permease PerM